MLRRQRDSAGVLRGLFNVKSRNLPAAAVLRADGKTVVREREGLLGWLKGIFNRAADKSNEDRASHEVAAALQQRDHPEIAVAEVDRKVDVVNQKLNNFGAAESTTERGDRKFRSVGQRNADERGRAVQQLAIYVESPSGVNLKEKRRSRQAPERGSDSLRSSSRLALPDKLHRAERIGAIEFAARDDPDVAAHYRCYTGPRHCYRLPPPPPRTRQPPLLLATYGPNRNISVPTRAIAACAAKHSKPPIREPNMPEKRERKDEKKRDKKEPVIRTERESIDSSESRAAMVAEDNPTGDPDAPFRYEWGVKLAEEEPAEASDNDNLAEKGRRYVTKRLWGVNLTHPDVEGAAPPTSDSPGSGAHRNASRDFESEDTAAEAGKTKVPPNRATANEQVESSWRAKDEKSLPTWTDSSSASGDSVTSQRDTSEVSLPSSQALRKIMRAVPGVSREAVVLDDDYNAPQEAARDAEISAWRSLASKSKPAMLAILSATRPEQLERVSIRPEAPQPKLDVRMVRSVEDITEGNKDEQSAGFKLSSMGLRRVGLMETPSLDDFSPSKKLHTSAQIHRDIARRGIGSLPADPAPASENTQRKDSNSEGSAEEKVSDVSNWQDRQQTDSGSLNEERSSSPDPSDLLGSTEQILSSAKVQTSGDQKQLDVEAEISEITNTIADEETEISTRQSQNADRESADRMVTSTTEESRAEDKSTGSEIESHEYSHSNYNCRDSYDVDQHADSEPTKSHEVGSAGEAAESIFASAKNTVLDSNAEDANDDDFGEQYVTDGDYARIPGDPYPYSKENLAKWRMPASRSLFYAPIKRQTVLSGLACDRSSPRNANDMYANAAGQSYGSHAVGTVMETSGSGDGAMGAKNVGLASGFRDSSRDQRVVAPDCDAVDGLRGWTEAFSRLDNAAATASGKTNEAERGDNASLRAYHQ
ncbi:uncharacterized protein LOC116849944 [Odontomachus brunneus]|uniref:uncharacterized protein LOC116849944 n=1 Tax=Odontomachus brunneus TaxID=486640 RepID=UPI0013F1BF1B|nr:uncharacterized protein LOC116849944 [Odontomachus brunneus]